jgi:adenine-specific DNA-methyltransferase
MPKTFNYIGSKIKLLDFIKDKVEEYTNKKCSELSSFGDLFSGTGVVSQYFAANGCKKIITNDIQHYGYVVSSVLTTSGIDIEKIRKEIVKINGMIEGIKDTTSANESHFVCNNYTEECKEEKRKYLSVVNGLKVDIARQYIEQLLNDDKITEQEWRCLLKVLLYAVTKVSNIASVYGAYLKEYKKCATKQIMLDTYIVDELIDGNDIEHKAYNKDIISLVDEMANEEIEVVYIDPPYNNRRYDQNFHVLETVSRYDYPQLKGKTGQRVEEISGAKAFCSKSRTKDAFQYIFDRINARYLIMSYNSEGILKKNEIISMLSKCWGEVDCIEIDYGRFKSNTNSEEKQQKLIKEYLFRGRKVEADG